MQLTRLLDRHDISCLAMTEEMGQPQHFMSRDELAEYFI